MMLVVWIYVGIKGYRMKDLIVKRSISILIILVCLIQEMIDFINRIFLDSNYLFSIQRDLPFLQFCQISFYFSLLCIFLSKKAIAEDGKYSSNQFLFDCSFLLGFSGAFQGIITPDFLNINNGGTGTDFGNLTGVRGNLGCGGNGHGGLNDGYQGYGARH